MARRRGRRSGEVEDDTEVDVGRSSRRRAEVGGGEAGDEQVRERVLQSDTAPSSLLIRFRGRTNTTRNSARALCSGQGRHARV